MTKADEALYSTLDLTWHILHTIAGQIKSYRTADKDGIINDDMLRMREELTRYRDLQREAHL